MTAPMGDDSPMETRLENSGGGAADAIARSSRLVAFTGAGISVESGIPPFRGPGGLWERYDPEILDIGYFNRDPEASWRAIKALFYDHWGRCEPNAAHRILADWERRGLLSFTITQNIDGLHSRAGCARVSEYHGSLRTLVCRRCGARRPADEAILATLPPLCAECGGILKPDFVFFGEGIPPDAAEAAAEAAGSCDCMLIIGTTGTVYPAAALPAAAKRRGAFVVEINPEPSEYSRSVSDLRIPLGAAAGMEALNQRLSGMKRRPLA